jgi:hypothetical protein
VARLLGVSGCVPPWGVVAATDVTAFEADPQVQPLGALVQAVGTSVDVVLAVVLLDVAPGIAPAQLPTEGLLDDLPNEALRSATFTAVGYGTVREEKTGGPHGVLPIDGVRRFALQTFRSLQPAWLGLSQQPSTGDAGTCGGDSGGPHFLGDETSNLLVSITVTGDAQCRAADKTYRLDTASARAFVGEFVDLP